MRNYFTYSGEPWDATAQLRARWYDSSIGRFIIEDTYEGELVNPLTLNLYTYVHNNPLRYVDPSGHRTVALFSSEGGGPRGMGGGFRMSTGEGGVAVELSVHLFLALVL